MRLPCLCTIEDQYLPLSGGERKVTCEHGDWIIEGRREVKTRFYIVQNPLEKKEEEKSGTGAE